MAYLAQAHDLRNLLSVAAKLRGLAAETLGKSDRSLYLTAAEALEKRAAWMSRILPQDRDDQDMDDTGRLHRPVNVFV